MLLCRVKEDLKLVIKTINASENCLVTHLIK